MIRLRYRGIFELEGLLKKIRGWLEDDGFEFQETAYKFKTPSPAGSELELDCGGKKKISEYTEYKISFYFHIWDMKKMEIIKDGKKKNVVQARMLIEMSGTAVIDYQKRFGGSKFLQGLGDWFTKFIVGKEIDNIIEDKLYYIMYKLHRVVKEYLDMETKTNAAEGRW